MERPRWARRQSIRKSYKEYDHGEAEKVLSELEQVMKAGTVVIQSLALLLTSCETLGKLINATNLSLLGHKMEMLLITGPTSQG